MNIAVAKASEWEDATWKTGMKSGHVTQGLLTGRTWRSVKLRRGRTVKSVTDSLWVPLFLKSVDLYALSTSEGILVLLNFWVLIRLCN